MNVSCAEFNRNMGCSESGASMLNSDTVRHEDETSLTESALALDGESHLTNGQVLSRIEPVANRRLDGNLHTGPDEPMDRSILSIIGISLDKGLIGVPDERSVAISSIAFTADPSHSRNSRNSEQLSRPRTGSDALDFDSRHWKIVIALLLLLGLSVTLICIAAFVLIGGNNDNNTSIIERFSFGTIPTHAPSSFAPSSLSNPPKAVETSAPSSGYEETSTLPSQAKTISPVSAPVLLLTGTTVPSSTPFSFSEPETIDTAVPTTSPTYQVRDILLRPTSNPTQIRAYLTASPTQPTLAPSKPSIQPVSKPTSQPSHFPTITESFSPSLVSTAKPTQCTDGDDEFIVAGNRVNCEWLADNRFYRTFVCIQGTKAYAVCKETCNRC